MRHVWFTVSPKRQGYVGVFAYFEGTGVSSREANGLLSFFFHEFRKKETDFIVTNSEQEEGH